MYRSTLNGTSLKVNQLLSDCRLRCQFNLSSDVAWGYQSTLNHCAFSTHDPKTLHIKHTPAYISSNLGRLGNRAWKKAIQSPGTTRFPFWVSDSWEILIPRVTWNSRIFGALGNKHYLHLPTQWRKNKTVSHLCSFTIILVFTSECCIFKTFKHFLYSLWWVCQHGFKWDA